MWIRPFGFVELYRDRFAKPCDRALAVFFYQTYDLGIFGIAKRREPMETSITKHTRDVVRLELAGWILADLLRLGCLLGFDAAHRAAGITVPPMPGRVELGATSAYSFEPSIHDIDIDRFPVGRTVMAMYDYAHEHIFPLGHTFDTFEAEMELVEDLVRSTQSELFYQFLRDPVHTWRAGDHDWHAVPYLLDRAGSRLALDRGEVVSIYDLALLASIDVKTVRNAQFANGPSRLAIQKDTPTDDGYVENDEARRWLSLRPSFKPTTFRGISATPGDHPDKLPSLSDLGGFIAERWAALGKTPRTVLEELQWSESRFDYVNGLTGAPQSIDVKDCEDLARSLAVSSTWFTAQVMRNLFPHEVALLLRHEKAVPGEEEPRKAPSAELSNRICDRVRFILHDGTEMFPVRMKNRATGLVCFRLSEGGAGGNTKERSIEIKDESDMIQKVCHEDMAVRLISSDGKRQGLYRSSGRSVRSVELDGQVI